MADHETAPPAAPASPSLIPSLGELWQPPAAAWQQDSFPGLDLDLRHPTLGGVDVTRGPVVHDPSAPPVPALPGSDRELERSIDESLRTPPPPPASGLFDWLMPEVSALFNTDQPDDSRMPIAPPGLSQDEKACTLLPSDEFAACADPGTRLSLPLRSEISEEGVQVPALERLFDGIFGEE